LSLKESVFYTEKQDRRHNCGIRSIFFHEGCFTYFNILCGPQAKLSKYSYWLNEKYLHVFFYVSLTVHLSITLVNDQLEAQIFNTFITILYMFRAISCSSSGGQILLIQHLVSSLSVSDLSVHRLRKNVLVILANDQFGAQIFVTFIIILYMFRAISCSYSGGQILLI